MNILVSAFACEPGKGSEPGVGWNWATTLARTHQVTVVTDTAHQAAIEKELALNPRVNLTVHCYRPSLLRNLRINSRTIYLLYSSWQILALPLFRRLHRKTPFDLAIHLTYGVFRQPTLLALTGIPTAIGPVGGGEDVPLRLKKSITGTEKLHELARTGANKVSMFDPLLWLALTRARWIFSKTEQTRESLPRFARARTVVLPEIGIDRVTEQPSNRSSDEPLKLLFAGRLLGWKGAHLALRATALARRQGVDAVLTVIGQGRFESELHRIADTCGMTGSAIRWISQLPQPQLFQEMHNSHALVFPSLHDSSGNVVLEAQAQGLPVVCLDCGGPATLVQSDSAIVIPTKDQSEDQVVEQIAQAIQRMAEDEHARLAMAHAALRNARQSSWHGRVEQYMAVIQA